MLTETDLFHTRTLDLLDLRDHLSCHQAAELNQIAAELERRGHREAVVDTATRLLSEQCEPEVHADHLVLFSQA